MNSARTLPDLTARQVKPGAGMCTKLLYLCGHKAQSTGGFFRGRIPMRCINCNKGAEVTQYEQIFRHLKQHRSATVRDETVRAGKKVRLYRLVRG